MRKFNVRQCGFDKMHMGKGLIENKLYQMQDQFSGNYIYKVLFNTSKQGTSIL